MKYIFTFLSMIIVIGLCYFLLYTPAVINNEKISTTLNQETTLVLFPKQASKNITINNQELAKNTCQSLEYLSNIYNNHNKYKSQKAAITFKYLSTTGLSQQDKEIILQNLKINILTYRKAISGRLINVSDLPAVQGDVRIIGIGKDAALKKSFEAHLFDKNYQLIINQVMDGLLTSQHVYDNLSVLSAIFVNDKFITSDMIRQLVSAGLAPSFADLVTATQLNLPKDIVIVLRDNYFDAIINTWYHNYHHNNLVMAAAENLNSDLFHYWFAESIPYEATPNDYNALDVLPTPSTDEERLAAIEIFSSLAQNSFYPYKNNTLTQIKQWLPLEIQQQFNDYFSHEKTKQLSNKGLQENEFLISRFEDDASKMNKLASYKIDDIKSQLASCYQLEFPKSDTINSPSLALGSDYIESKRKSHENIKNMSEEDQITLQRVNKLYDFILHQQWDILIEQVETISNETNTEWLYSSILLDLILANAPEKPINAMLAHRVILSPETIFILITNDNVELAKKLLNYDLDVNYKKNNMSALEHAKKHQASQEMIDFISQF